MSTRGHPAISALIYLTDRRDRRVVAYNMAEMATWNQAALPVQPSHLIANPAIGMLAASDPATNRMWLLSATDLELRLALDLNVSPWLIAFAPDGRHLAAGDMSSGLIQIIDPETGATRYTAEGFTGVHDLRFAADSGSLFASTLDTSRVRRIDLTTRETGTVFAIDGATDGIDHMTRTANGAAGIVVTPMRAGQHLAVVDLTAQRVVREWQSDQHYWRAYTDPFSRWFLLASDRNAGLDAIDARSGVHVARIATDMPIDLFTAGFVGTSLIVGERASGRLALIDGTDLTVADAFDAGGPVHSVFMDDSSGQATVVRADGTFITFDAVPRRGMIGLAKLAERRLDIDPDLSAHANALNFCHS